MFWGPRVLVPGCWGVFVSHPHCLVWWVRTMTDKQGNISSYPFWVGGALSGLLSTPFCWLPKFFGGFGVEGFVSACGWAAVCGGLVVCGWVVGELYSGCFCVFIFCVISVFEFFLCGFSFCGRSVDALVSRADEGRGGLRYSSGS